MGNSEGGLFFLLGYTFVFYFYVSFFSIFKGMGGSGESHFFLFSFYLLRGTNPNKKNFFLFIVVN
jgi:hypothetical protein